MGCLKRSYEEGMLVWNYSFSKKIITLIILKKIGKWPTVRVTGHNNQIGRYTHKRLDIKNITHQNNDKNGRKKSYRLSTFIIFEWSFGDGQTT